MLTVQECSTVATLLPDHLEGVLSEGELMQVKGHLIACEACRARLKRMETMHQLLRGFLGPDQVSGNMVHETSKKLSAITGGVLPALPAFDPSALADRRPARQATLGDMLRRAPWWAISGAFHALLLLLMTLIGAAMLRANDEVVIVTDLQRLPPPEEKIEPVKRDLFKKPEITQTADVTVDQPVVEHHEEVQIADHEETVNDSDLKTAQGDEHALSDVPLSGSGLAASLGLGGGGGGVLGHRVGGGRTRLALKNGGSEKTESAVNAGLAWLARVQEADGHWDSKKFGGGNFHNPNKAAASSVDVAATGMALLAFLGAGHTEKVGRYKDNVQRGVAWLLKSQQANGELGPSTDITGYAHAIAGMALSEAAAMGRVQATREAAQKAVDRTCGAGAKWEEDSERAGWSYAAYQYQELYGDISNSGWHMMFVKSAKVAGLHINPSSIEGITRFLDSVERGKKEGEPYSGHRYTYQPRTPNEGTERQTAIGCLCRLFFGTPPEELKGGVEYMLHGWPGGYPKAHPVNGGVELYYVYYGTLVTFQMGGEMWAKWNEAMQQALLPHQIKDGGANDGSWNPEGQFAPVWGRVGQTAMALLCLEVYYRYLPMYR